MSDDLWQAGSIDEVATLRSARLLTEARTRARESWSFLAGATDLADFENRRSLQAQRLDEVVAKVTDASPGDFLSVRAALEDSFIREFDALHSVRVAERVAAETEHRQALAAERARTEQLKAVARRRVASLHAEAEQYADKIGYVLKDFPDDIIGAITDGVLPVTFLSDMVDAAYTGSFTGPRDMWRWLTSSSPSGALSFDEAVAWINPRADEIISVRSVKKAAADPETCDHQCSGRIVNPGHDDEGTKCDNCGKVIPLNGVPLRDEKSAAKTAARRTVASDGDGVYMSQAYLQGLTTLDVSADLGELKFVGVTTTNENGFEEQMDFSLWLKANGEVTVVSSGTPTVVYDSSKIASRKMSASGSVYMYKRPRDAEWMGIPGSEVWDDVEAFLPQLVDGTSPSFLVWILNTFNDSVSVLDVDNSRTVASGKINRVWSYAQFFGNEYPAEMLPGKSSSKTAAAGTGDPVLDGIIRYWGGAEAKVERQSNGSYIFRDSGGEPYTVSPPGVPFKVSEDSGRPIGSVKRDEYCVRSLWGAPDDWFTVPKNGVYKNYWDGKVTDLVEYGKTAAVAKTAEVAPEALGDMGELEAYSDQYAQEARAEMDLFLDDEWSWTGDEVEVIDPYWNDASVTGSMSITSSFEDPNNFYDQGPDPDADDDPDMEWDSKEAAGKKPPQMKKLDPDRDSEPQPGKAEKEPSAKEQLQKDMDRARQEDGKFASQHQAADDWVYDEPDTPEEAESEDDGGEIEETIEKDAASYWGSNHALGAVEDDESSNEEDEDGYGAWDGDRPDDDSDGDESEGYDQWVDDRSDED